MRFVSWQYSPHPPGVAPYNRPSPGLMLVRAAMIALFGATGGYGYSERPIRGGKLPSSHWYGAAWDGTITDDATRRAAIGWLIANHEWLGIMAIHDYFGRQQWRATGRPGGKWLTVKPGTPGWEPRRYLHIEIHPDWWADTTPLDQRGPGYKPGAAPTPTPPKDEDDDMAITIYHVEGANAQLIGSPQGPAIEVAWSGSGDDPKVLPMLAALRGPLGAKEVKVPMSACQGMTFRGDPTAMIDGLHQWTGDEFFAVKAAG